MRRRDFITLLGGAAMAWPIAVRAQQGERTRRVGVLMGYPEGDRQAQANVTALRQALENLGWIGGRNIQIDYRWAGADPDKARAFAKEFDRVGAGRNCTQHKPSYTNSSAGNAHGTGRIRVLLGTRLAAALSRVSHILAGTSLASPILRIRSGANGSSC